MSRKSVVKRNLRRESVVSHFASKRKEIKAAWLDMSTSIEHREAAYLRLQKLPRDSSPVRLRIRCALTGRPRGVFRRFGVSRSQLRQMVMNGEVPGIVKSSW